MSKHNVVRLEDLKRIFIKKQEPIPSCTDPIVDGSDLTNNIQVKYRRKRILSSKNYKTKRPHIEEFINACRFVIGETSHALPMSQQHLNILSSVRRGMPVPEKYQSVVSNNWDIVQKAAELKPREIRAKYSVEQNETTIKEEQTVTRKENPKNIRASKEGAQKFEQWLLNNMSDIPFDEKERHLQYAGIVSYYQSHNSEVAEYMPKYAKEVLDKFAESLKSFKPSKKRLKLISELPAEPKHDDSLDASSYALQDMEITKKEIQLANASLESKTINIQKPSMQDFMEYLKDLGVKEFSIKF